MERILRSENRASCEKKKAAKKHLAFGKESLKVVIILTLVSFVPPLLITAADSINVWEQLYSTTNDPSTRTLSRSGIKLLLTLALL